MDLLLGDKRRRIPVVCTTCFVFCSTSWLRRFAEVYWPIPVEHLSDALFEKHFSKYYKKLCDLDESKHLQPQFSHSLKDLAACYGLHNTFTYFEPESTFCFYNILNKSQQPGEEPLKKSGRSYATSGFHCAPAKPISKQNLTAHKRRHRNQSVILKSVNKNGKDEVIVGCKSKDTSVTRLRKLDSNGPLSHLEKMILTKNLNKRMNIRNSQINAIAGNSRSQNNRYLQAKRKNVHSSFIRRKLENSLLGSSNKVAIPFFRRHKVLSNRLYLTCLLYTSDAADDMQCVDLGGRRIIKKKTT
eukprot:TRINITY_DN7703_c0_g1_i2.p1 TRINITY_DN7703_c0_g1~~TRINITY_DN7703_c0_g1_i2.p1  ORF type:complete len:300 (-),score=19.08 TRINITY_DN7703_c0_g1_i2:1-900(-)